MWRQKCLLAFGTIIFQISQLLNPRLWTMSAEQPINAEDDDDDSIDDDQLKEYNEEIEALGSFPVS